MASRSEVAEIVLRYSLDRKSVNEVTRAGELVRKELDKTAKQTLSISDAARKVNAELAEMARERAIRQIAANFHEAERAGTKTADALAQVSRKLAEIGASDAEIKQVTRSLVEAGNAASRVSAGGAGRSIGDQVDVTGSRFSQLLSGLGGGEAANISGLIGDLGDFAQVLPTLGTGAVAAGGATAALVVALELFKQANDKAAQSVRSWLAVQDEYVRLIVSGTRADFEARLAAARVDAQVAQQTIDQNRAIMQAFEAEVNPYQTGLGQLGIEIARVTNAGGFRELADSIAKAEGELRNANLAINLYENSLRTNASATNDAAVARAEAEQYMANTAQQVIRARLEAEQFAATATTEAVNQRVAAFQQELASLTTANQTLAAQGTAAANALIDENLARAQWLRLSIEATNATKAEIAAREQLEAGQTQAREAFFGLLDGLRGLPKAGAEFDKFAKGVTEARKKIDEEEARHAQAAEKIRADLAEKEAAILADANERAGDLADKYGVDRLRAEEDLQRELRQLRRRAAIDQKTAEGERDAVAARKAQDAAKQQEEDLLENQTVLARRREEDYKRQLQELARTTNQRLQTERNAAQKSLMLEVDKYNKEIEVRRQALVAAQTQMAQYMQGVLNIGGQGYPVALQQFGAFMGGIQSIILAQLQQTQQTQTIIPQTTVGIGVGGGRYVAQRALGGWSQGWTIVNDGTGSMRGAESTLTADKRLIYFDKPARVFNAQQTAAMGGGSNQVEVNINLDGKTIKAASRAEALRAIDEVFERMEIN